MAKIELTLPEDFLRSIDTAADGFAEAADEALQAGAQVVLKEMRSQLQKRIQHSGESELVQALGVTDTKKNRSGSYNVKIGFDEHRRDGETNAKLAMLVEYGSRKRNRPERPFLKPTRTKSKAAAAAAMTAVVERWLEGKG
jgi:HK97 gp10 family phage protein